MSSIEVEPSAISTLLFFNFLFLYRWRCSQRKRFPTSKVDGLL